MKAVKHLSLAWRMMLILLIPSIGLFTFGVQGVGERRRVIRECESLTTLSKLAEGVGNVVHELQKERGRSAGFLGSKGTKFQSELPAQRKDTDRVLKTFSEHLGKFHPEQYGAELVATLERGSSALEQLPVQRNLISALQMTGSEAIQYYTDAISALLNVATYMSKVSTDAEITRQVFAYVNFLEAKERIGIERATLSNVFAAGAFQPGMFFRFASVLAGRDVFLNSFHSLARPEQWANYNSVVAGPAVQEVSRLERIAIEQAAGGDFGVSPDHWFATITRKIDKMKQVEDSLAADLQHTAWSIQQAAQKALRNLAIMLAAVFAGLVATGILSSVTVRSVTAPLRRVIGDLTAGSRAVGSKARQIRETSEVLNRDAATEASSLEETMASLDSLAADAQGNAERAESATRLSRQNRQRAEGGARDVVEMSNAMVAVRSANANISKVTKLIDEIAFQTNILALNAAVEAARAGSAGAGFSVVAEEVRRLAQRSAEAARETGQLVTESLGKTDAAMAVSQKVSSALSQIAGSALEMDGIVARIAESSEHQCSRVAHVNTVVAEMNKAVHTTAAVAEDSSRRAAELSEQAVVFDNAVQQVSSLIGRRGLRQCPN